MKKKLKKVVTAKPEPWTFEKFCSVIPKQWQNKPVTMADIYGNEAPAVMRVGIHYETTGKCHILLYRSPITKNESANTRSENP